VFRMGECVDASRAPGMPGNRPRHMGRVACHPPATRLTTIRAAQRLVNEKTEGKGLSQKTQDALLHSMLAEYKLRQSW
jgi:hypothetical protein